MATTDMIIPMLTKMREEMNARFEEMNARFGEMDKRFDAVDQRFDAVDQRFDSMEDRLEQLEHQAAVTNSKLDTLTTRVAHVEVVCHEAWTQMSATALFANQFERRQAGELAELRARVEKLESRDPK